MKVSNDDADVGAGCPDRPEWLRPLVLLEVSFEADPAAIRPVRRQLHAALSELGLEQVADEVVQAAQELMANAVEHGCRCRPPKTTVTVKAVYRDEQVRVDVHDPSDERPQERPESGERESGRGLSIVGVLADRWGVKMNRAGTGKSVWLEFDAPFVRGEQAS
ncbi:ATP-binding protein [Streptomyces sp. NPDC050988]|uniref:ATP-binding protein n=1 Tax=Streptomyces sp. NPDC050988 TaxID=3365637 RepID=UPI0037A8D1D4